MKHILCSQGTQVTIFLECAFPLRVLQLILHFEQYQSVNISLEQLPQPFPRCSPACPALQNSPRRNESWFPNSPLSLTHNIFHFRTKFCSTPFTASASPSIQNTSSISTLSISLLLIDYKYSVGTSKRLVWTAPFLYQLLILSGMVAKASLPTSLLWIAFIVTI